jgi:hypothetical protein
MATVALADKVVHLHRGLARAKIPHAFGGALALAYFATPRATVDIDVNVFVGPERHASIAAVLKRIGAETIPEEGVAQERGQWRAWWGRSPVDVFFAYDEIHERMRSAVRTVPFGSAEIPILAPEHLLVAKVIYDRAKDWIDIEQMLVAVDDLDLDEVRWGLTHLMGETDARTRHLEELIAELR